MLDFIVLFLTVGIPLSSALLLASLGETVNQRSGVFNLGCEGVMSMGAFVGMLTDSRSLLSYPRHHYFRRILFNYLGNMMENGEMTTDLAFVGKVVQDISYNNAVAYLEVE